MVWASLSVEAREIHQGHRNVVPQQLCERLQGQKPGNVPEPARFVCLFFLDLERCPRTSLTLAPRWPQGWSGPKTGLAGSRGVWRVLDVVANIDKNIQTLDFS